MKNAGCAALTFRAARDAIRLYFAPIQCVLRRFVTPRRTSQARKETE